MGVERRYFDKDRLAAHINATCPQASYDFAFMFSSGYPEWLEGSIGGGAAVYLPICYAEHSGVVLPVAQRLCTSSDQIQGLMSLPNLDRWLVDFRWLVPYVFLHEMGHRWGALARTSVIGVNMGFHHWKTPYPTSGLDYFEIDSVMGGVPGSNAMFAWLDLYLMGLVPPSMVPPYDYVREDGERIPVPIESIIEATGPRVPAYPDAPSHFRVAFVVLTPTGHRPRACELELAQEWSEEFPAWWHEGTRGTSTVEVGLLER